MESSERSDLSSGLRWKPAAPSGDLTMPVNPADSPILGTLYGSDAMRSVFDETAYFQHMLDVEAALARVQGRMGIIPADAADAITRAARIENLRTDELAASA